MKKRIKVSTVKVAAEAEVIFLNSALVSRVTKAFVQMGSVARHLENGKEEAREIEYGSHVHYQMEVSDKDIERIQETYELLSDIMDAFNEKEEEDMV